MLIKCGKLNTYTHKPRLTKETIGELHETTIKYIDEIYNCTF